MGYRLAWASDQCRPRHRPLGVPERDTVFKLLGRSVVGAFSDGERVFIRGELGHLV